MPGEPSAHEGAPNLSPGRPKTGFSAGVRCICCQQSAQIGTRPHPPLGWRRKRGHDAPKKSAGGGGLTGDLVGASSAHIWVWGRGELKMQKKLAPFGHRKRRKRNANLPSKGPYPLRAKPALSVLARIEGRKAVGRAPAPSIKAVSISLELPRVLPPSAEHLPHFPPPHRWRARQRRSPSS